MAKNTSISIVAKGKFTDIVISGIISDETNSAMEICSAINTATSNGGTAKVVLMNCFGGSVYEAVVVYNLIKKLGLDTEVQGICASAATIIFCAGKNRTIGYMGRLMLHAPSVPGGGNSQVLRDSADMLDGIAKEFCKVYSECTGMPEDKVMKAFLDGGDHWVDADQARKYGFATANCLSVFKHDIPADVLASSNVQAVANYFQKQILINNNEMDKLPLIVAALALSASATEQDVLTKVTALVKESNELKEAKVALEKELNDLKVAAAAAQVAQCEALVNAALDAKKIKPVDKERYLALAKLDYANTAAILDSMKGHVAISEIMKMDVKEGGENRANWTVEMWQKNDPDGLSEMRTNDKAGYEALVAKLGKKIAKHTA